MSTENDRRRQRADQRLFATMDDDDQRVTARMEEIRAMNVSTPRDKLLSLRIGKMKQSLRSGDKKHRILFVTGESNAGKSRLVANALAADAAFRKYEDDDGWATPLLLQDAPSPCTQRNFAIRLINGLGFPVRAKIRESEIWPLLEEQLRAHRVRFIVIDEAQRTMKIKDQAELQKLSDSLIGLVDSRDWPVRIILIGVDPLDILRTRDSQMRNRSKPMRLAGIPAQKVGRIETWIKEIVCDHAALGMPDIDVADTARRLRHACDGNAGSIIELIRAAVELVLKSGRSNVSAVDFAQAYADLTDCEPQDNLFETKLWEALPSGLAKIVKTDDAEDASVNLKPLKPGERPR
ncbi:AAA family ATPase [Rhizobium leguminosarum]|uniref:TniB family NTP-binding protein n=1 Tax=Rhizobium leguminosarum TaxID=384 RepID=UPI001C96B56B|nr:ATP-binding protein [Rhizobium leguminosarum]MBY5591645.1 AAA family ATPase [Rhizobium leguminosarum]